MKYSLVPLGSYLSLVVLATLILSGCQPLIVDTTQPAVAESTPPAIELPTESIVVDGVGPSSASDPEQARAEDEFLAAVLAKEQAYYDGDVDALLSFYADDAISTWPESPEIIGKEAIAEGVRPFIENNEVVGNLTVKRINVTGDRATRQAEWEEVVIPNDGSEPVHYIGRCTLEWEKIDGEWKVVSEFINYLEPPTSVSIQ